MMFKGKETNKKEDFQIQCSFFKLIEIIILGNVLVGSGFHSKYKRVGGLKNKIHFL